MRRHSRPLRTAALLAVFGLLPAAWDRARHRAAWDAVVLPDAGAEAGQRSLHYFERQSADRPYDTEAAAGLGLARFRAGLMPSEPPKWRQISDEWSAVRELTRVLAALKSNRRGEAQAALRDAKAAGYAPRSEAERRLYEECGRALAGKG